MDHTQVSARAVAKVVLVAAGVIAALYFSYLIRTVIGLVVIAAFFAVAIAPAVNWLDHRKVPRWAAILLVYLGISGGIFGIGLLIVPPLVTGVESLSSDLPGYVDDLRNNQTFRDYDNRYHITEKLKEQADQLPSKLGDAAGTLRDVTVGVFSRFVQLFSILVITFFLVKDGDRLLEFFYRQMPQGRASRFRKKPSSPRCASRNSASAEERDAREAHDNGDEREHDRSRLLTDLGDEPVFKRFQAHVEIGAIGLLDE